MGRALGKADEGFMAERNQPAREEKRKSLGPRRGKRR
jgi:hypothetical protein